LVGCVESRLHKFLLGTFPWFTPKFVKPRLNAADQMRAAIEEWKKSI